jgi:PAS domain S-box-containing protein
MIQESLTLAALVDGIVLVIMLAALVRMRFPRGGMRRTTVRYGPAVVAAGLMLVGLMLVGDLVALRGVSSTETYRAFRLTYGWAGVLAGIGAVTAGFIITTRELRSAPDEKEKEVFDVMRGRAGEQGQPSPPDPASLMEQAHRMARIGAWEWLVKEQRAVWSDETYRLLGLEPQSLEPTPEVFLRFVHPDDRAAVRETAARVSAGEKSAALEIRALRADGAVRCFRVEGAEERDAGDRVVRIAGFVQDVTGQKRGPESGREREDLLRLALEGARMGTWDWDLRTGAVTWSDHVEELFGLPPGRFDGSFDMYLSLVHPEDRGKLEEAVEASLAGSSAYYVEHRIFWQDGTVHWLQGKGKVYRDEAGEPVRMAGVVADITEQKHAREALRESEARYRALVEHAPEAIVVLDVETGRFVDCNTNAEMFFGRSRDRLFECGPSELSPEVQPDGRLSTEVAREVLQRAVAGEEVTLEWTHTDVSGAEIPCEVRLVRLPARGRILVRGSIMDISDRKKARERLILTQFSLDHAADAVFWVDAEGHFFYVNEEACRLLAHEREELLGMTLPDIDEIITHAYWPSLWTLAKNAGTFKWESRLWRRDGGWVPVEWHLNHQDFEGRSFICAFVRDMSDRRVVEEALRASEERYRAFVANSSEGIWRCELEAPFPVDLSEEEQIERIIRTGFLAECNVAYARDHGYESLEDILGMSMSDLFGEESPFRTLILPEFVRSGYRLVDVETKEHDREGRVRYFLTSLVGVVTDGLFYRAWGTHREITDRKMAEEALRESEARLARAQRIGRMGSWMWDLGTGRQQWSDETFRIFGYEPGEVEESREFFLARVHPEDVEHVRSVVAEMLERREPFSLEYRIRWPDGSVRTIQAESVIRVDDEHGALRLEGMVMDVTERKEAEAALQRTQQALDAAADAVFWIAKDGRLLYVNVAACQSLGYTEEELRQRSVYDFTPGDVEYDWSIVWDAVRIAGNYTFEARHRRKDGSIFPVEISAKFMVFAERPFICAFARDITERVQAQRERERLIADLETKNAELEQFTYTVSHDLKSPLVTIKGFLGLLREDLRAGDQVRVEQDMLRIEKAANKMQRLLEELLQLSRIGRLVNPPEKASLEPLIREAVEQVSGRIEEGGVEVTVATEMPPVWGDRVRLLEVFQNLIDNAVKFMGDQPRPQVEIGARRQGRGEVLCWVRDNGMGIDKRYHEKVFGLFERLDNRVEGTGIGLALVKRIVEVHGGRIWVESGDAAPGSVFWFTLPGVDDPAA